MSEVARRDPPAARDLATSSRRAGIVQRGGGRRRNGLMESLFAWAACIWTRGRRAGAGRRQRACSRIAGALCRRAPTPRAWASRRSRRASARAGAGGRRRGDPAQSRRQCAEIHRGRRAGDAFGGTRAAIDIALVRRRHRRRHERGAGRAACFTSNAARRPPAPPASAAAASACCCAATSPNGSAASWRCESRLGRGHDVPPGPAGRLGALAARQCSHQPRERRRHGVAPPPRPSFAREPAQRRLDEDRAPDGEAFHASRRRARRGRPPRDPPPAPPAQAPSRRGRADRRVAIAASIRAQAAGRLALELPPVRRDAERVKPRDHRGDGVGRPTARACRRRSRSAVRARRGARRRTAAAVRAPGAPSVRRDRRGDRSTGT